MLAYLLTEIPELLVVAGKIFVNQLHPIPTHIYFRKIRYLTAETVQVFAIVSNFYKSDQ